VWASLWSDRILAFIQVLCELLLLQSDMQVGKMTESIISTMTKASMAVVIQAQIDSRLLLITCSSHI
jgi:hypothetical protein